MVHLRQQGRPNVLDGTVKIDRVLFGQTDFARIAVMTQRSVNDLIWFQVTGWIGRKAVAI